MGLVCVRSRVVRESLVEKVTLGRVPGGGGRSRVCWDRVLRVRAEAESACPV